MNVVTSKYLTDCHTGNVLVFEKPVKVFGGGASRGAVRIPGALLLDVGSHLDSLSMSSTLPVYLTQWVGLAVKIDWPDFHAPDLPPSFWQDLCRAILELELPVQVACCGGHGRTGTALAILGGLLKAISPIIDPITVVRKMYCTKAIESMAQLEYVEEVLGYTASVKEVKETERREDMRFVQFQASHAWQSGAYENWGGEVVELKEGKK